MFEQTKVANIAPINEESFHKKLKFNDVNEHEKADFYSFQKLYDFGVNENLIKFFQFIHSTHQ